MSDERRTGFGERLWRLRRTAGLTQEELAARAGLSPRGISDLERGLRQTPRRDTVALLADALALAGDERVAFIAAARRPVAPADRPVAVDGDEAETSARNDSGGDELSQPGTPSRGQIHNLPAQSTHLIGREEAVRTVGALVRRADVRLVTLTGPGGVGKTRLALEVAATLLRDFADGAWYVRLSRLSDPNLVIPTIAQTLGLKEAGGQPLGATLREHLRDRCLLLVLDNFEHVVAAAAEVAGLLRRCPALKVVATSRTPLRLSGEHEVPVIPLDLPPAANRAPAYVTWYPAVELFVERAQAARPDFALTAANAQAITDICVRLDGLPLAIELAAARVKLLPPSALLARLEHGLGVLTGGARDLDERQQTMRATLAWSGDLLAPGERALFCRMAIFAGGCTLEAAEAVCVAPSGVAPLEVDPLDGLDALVNHSLVQQREEGGEARFGLLHVVREHAMEQLESSGEADALHRAHAAWMLALAERAEPELTGPGAGAWLDRLEREHDNLRVALTWACAHGEAEIGLRVVAAVFRFWVVRGHLREGRAWAERLLALEAEGAAQDGASGTQTGTRTTGDARARALRAAGVLALYQADEQAAGAWLEQSVARGRAAGDLQTAAFALNSLGVATMHQGDLARARALLEESLAYLRAVGEPRAIASTLINLGVVAFFRGDLEQAVATQTEALALARQVGDRDYEGTALANLASVALLRGEVERGESLGRDALALYHDLGDPRRCAVGLEGLAKSAGMAADGVRAARLLGAASALREALGTPLASHERGEVEEAIAAAQATLSEEQWAAAFAAGEALSLEEAVTEALGHETPPTEPR